MRKFLGILIFSILLVIFIPSFFQSKFVILFTQNNKAELVSFDTQLSFAQSSSNPVKKSLESVDKTFTSNDKKKPASAQDGENILGLLRDPIWQFIGLVITIIISLITCFLQKTKKSLAYEILAETALLSVAKEVKDKIQILFEGDSVQNVHLILLKISNTGNVPILESDFDEEITISFDSSTRLLSAEISKKNPHSIKAELTIKGTQLIISKSLWNSGDTITIKSLVSEFNEKIDVSGRIVGIKDIKKLSNSESYIYERGLYFIVFLCLTSTFLYIFTNQYIFYLLAIICAFVVFINYSDYILEKIREFFKLLVNFHF